MSNDLLNILLEKRGISSDGYDAFLNPSYKTHLYNPFLMKDIDKAISRIRKAVLFKEKIAIFADYDCDGIPGAVILHGFLKKIGHNNIEVYIPDRHKEGYGLNKTALNKLKEIGVTLIITVDLGISDVKDVLYANRIGLDVIVTDHHLAQEELPPACAILNPNQPGCEYPFKGLCGAGVVFKLICALQQSYIKEKEEGISFPVGQEKWFLDMVAIATLSDMVPLIDENRALAYFGLVVLRKSRRPGIQQLLRKLRIDQKYLSEDDIGYMIAPRLNAASRMDNPMRAFELLATEDIVVADELTVYLTKLNNERKIITAGIMKEVKKILTKRDIGEVIVIGNPKWRPGVLGLVSGKLVDEYGRPAFVWGGADDNGILKGSCRSDGSVNLVSMMQYIPDDMFSNFGGHEKAAGFSITKEKVHFLEESLLKAYSKSKNKKDKNKKDTNAEIDIQIYLSDVSMETWKLVEKLSPFGVGNKKPLFEIRDIFIKEVRQFGVGKQHLEITISSKNNDAEKKAIAFFSNINSFTKPIIAGESINLLAHLDLSRFNGRVVLRLRIVDVS